MLIFTKTEKGVERKELHMDEAIHLVHKTGSGESLHITIKSGYDSILVEVESMVTRAYNEFMTKLFGSVPDNPREIAVERSRYESTLQAIVAKYGFEEGYPVSLEWAFVLMGRGPRIIEKDGTLV